MVLDKSQLLTYFKAISRGNPLPLDASSVWESKQAAQEYASGATGYAGQSITVLENGKYVQYILQPSDSGYTLEKPGVDAAAVKQYVQIVTALPATGIESGVLYINTTNKTGNIYDAATKKWTTVFSDVNANIGDVVGELPEGKTVVQYITDGLALKANIAGTTFTGPVKVAADPADNLGVATKQYVDRLVAQLEQSSTPGVVNPDSPIPDNYKAGMMWRVSVTGNYVGQACEPGDLIIALKDISTPVIHEASQAISAVGPSEIPRTAFAEGETFRVDDYTKDNRNPAYYNKITAVSDTVVTVGNGSTNAPELVPTASDSDFIVVQANITGAVTSSVNASTNGQLVVFDGTSGKIIKSSTIVISSLQSAMDKANSALQEADVAEMRTDVGTLKTDVAALKTSSGSVASDIEALQTAVDSKANAADVYDKTTIDGKVTAINNTLDSKADTSAVDSKIADAKKAIATEYAAADADILEQAKTYADSKIPTDPTGITTAQLNARLGTEISETTTVAKYIETQLDSVVGVVEFS